MKELAEIQRTLNCPKNRKNNFGGYSYRSCSDILDAFKGVANGCQLIVTDEVKEIGGANFVEATATITNPSGESVSTKGFAQICDHKGMDAAQSTGASSSYARKYALNGLLAIDDTEDNDDIAARTPQEKKATAYPKYQKPAAQPTAQPQSGAKRKIPDEKVQGLINWAIENNKGLQTLLEQFELTDAQVVKVKQQIG